MNSYRRSALCSQGPKTQESALTHFHVRLLISVVLNARHCLVSVTVILSGWGRETKHETKHACPFFAPWTFNLALLCPSCTLDLQPCTTVLFLHLGPPTLHCCVVLAPWTSNLAPPEGRIWLWLQCRCQFRRNVRPMAVPCTFCSLRSPKWIPLFGAKLEPGRPQNATHFLQSGSELSELCRGSRRAEYGSGCSAVVIYSGMCFPRLSRAQSESSLQRALTISLLMLFVMLRFQHQRPLSVQLDKTQSGSKSSYFWVLPGLSIQRRRRRRRRSCLQMPILKGTWRAQSSISTAEQLIIAGTSLQSRTFTLTNIPKLHLQG